MITTTPKTILLIDDCAEEREIFRLYLENNREPIFHFLEADSGKVGWEMFQKAQPDCVLLDYQLPDVNGIEFMKKLLHADDAWIGPVILLTGCGDDTIARHALKNGAADYLVKRKMTAEAITRAVTTAIEKSVLIQKTEAQHLEVERSHAELTQFAHRASHDLQAPTRRIINYLELMEKDLRGHLTEQSENYLSRCLKNAHYMRQLIKNLLEYSLVGGGQRPFLPVNLSETVHEVLNELEDVIQEAQARITIAPLPTILGNPALLQQLFQNILSNAIRFRQKQAPQIDVSVHQQGECWHVQVRDDGVGIPLQFLTKIFDVFERLDNANVPKGTGIGLALCKKIIEFHGGKIWVNSVEGQGSVFSLTFLKLSPEEFTPNPEQPRSETLCQSEVV